MSAPAARSEPSNVRPLAAAATRSCSRPGCPSPATATAFLDYAGRSVMLTPLTETPEEHAYDLCVTHATRTSPPRGWLLQDRRPDLRPTGQPVDPDLLGSPDTVALLARALRAVPDAPDQLDELSELVDPIEQASSALDAAIAHDPSDDRDDLDIAILAVTIDPAAVPEDPPARTQDQPALEW